MEFFKKLRLLMASTGMSQSDVAAAVGVSQSLVSKWVRGESAPSLEDAFALSRHFGVSIVFLADNSIADPSETGLPPDELAVLELYRALGLSKDEALRRLAGSHTRLKSIPGGHVVRIGDTILISVPGPMTDLRGELDPSRVFGPYKVDGVFSLFQADQGEIYRALESLRHMDDSYIRDKLLYVEYGAGPVLRVESWAMVFRHATGDESVVKGPGEYLVFTRHRKPHSIKPRTDPSAIPSNLYILKLGNREFWLTEDEVRTKGLDPSLLPTMKRIAKKSRPTEAESELRRLGDMGIPGIRPRRIDVEGDERELSPQAQPPSPVPSIDRFMAIDEEELQLTDEEKEKLAAMKPGRFVGGTRDTTDVMDEKNRAARSPRRKREQGKGKKTGSGNMPVGDDESENNSGTPSRIR